MESIYSPPQGNIKGLVVIFEGKEYVATEWVKSPIYIVSEVR